MARVSFIVPESGEKTFKLTPERPLSIGRDPGNDIVLRDGKVSRTHARINFERGFYVIHDLGSSNGTFVNGRKVRAAPLTDGAGLRLGSCTGRFSEELAENRPGETRPEVIDDFARPTAPDIDLSTAPHEIPGKTELGDEAPPSGKKKTAEAPAPAADSFSATELGEPKQRSRRFLIDLRSTEQEIAAVRDEAEKPLFFFRNPVTLVGFVARLMAAMIAISGAATALFLFWQRHAFPGLTAAILTVSFLFVILMLVPRQQIVLYSDSALSSIALMLIQESRFSFPSLRFSLRKADGSIIGGFQKNLASNFGLRRWWILDRPGRSRLGYAKEESLARALLRLLIATVRTNFRLYFHDRPIGLINRRLPTPDKYVLELNDPNPNLDQRLAIGLAVLIDSVEGR